MAYPMGLTIIEPTGDLCGDVRSWCERRGLPFVHIDVERPDSHRVNILQGDPVVCAEAARTVLKEIFGKQEAFFSAVQELAARNTVLLLKRLRGDQVDLPDLLQALRDENTLQHYVDRLESREGETELVKSFRHEILGKHKDEFRRFGMGLRVQIDDMVNNPLLNRVMSGNSDIDFDRHLAEGGVLLINTSMGPLGELGDTFGKFCIMHMQGAVFRRPGSEWTRKPHGLVVDEFPRYVNPAFERLVAIGRKYRCFCILALQSTAQLELEAQKAFVDIMLTNCRNKIVFGGLSKSEAQRFEQEFGAVPAITRQNTYDYKTLAPMIFPRSFRTTTRLEPRFPYTKIMELSDFKFIYRIVNDGALTTPRIGFNRLVDPRKLEIELPHALQKVLGWLKRSRRENNHEGERSTAESRGQQAAPTGAGNSPPPHTPVREAGIRFIKLGGATQHPPPDRLPRPQPSAPQSRSTAQGDTRQKGDQNSGDPFWG
jgi:hypothetical protein